MPPAVSSSKSAASAATEQPVPAQLLLRALELQNQGRNADAAVLLHEVLAADPANAPAYYSLALIAYQDHDLPAALRLCATGRSHAPYFAPLALLQGAVLRALGQREAALQSFDVAIQINPRYPEALINSGVLLRDMHRHKEALERFNNVLVFDPTNVTALANCAILLTEFKQSESAIKMFERLLQLQPDYDYGLGLLSYERLHICDWREFDALRAEILHGLQAGKRTCKTLPLMALSDQAADHLQAARLFAAHQNPRAGTTLWQGQRYRHPRIRLGYVSPDFREHPVGHLLAGIFEQHDRSRFETYAFSLGRDDGSTLRGRIVQSFDHFIDCSSLDPLAIAQQMHAAEIDIAVDLAGYTADSRMQIFSYRPAPVQVTYLGYPGTTGTDYMDYILADRIVIPPDHQHLYTERVVYLPDCYLPVASGVALPERTPSRAQCGLPESGVVFCSFNHDYKIGPHVFALWMQLLREVPDSVLWLMARNELSQRNLCEAAQAHDVAPSRLVFAQRVPRVEDHLARYRQADLFLDTHPYNAHTTAADALLAGLPVITWLGHAFPSRVAASLLHSAGLPELITTSPADYVALARRLALDPAALAQCKTRLRESRLQATLFDTQQFCRDLEASWFAMWRRSQLGDTRDELG